jgi:hypothetical protein
MKKDLLGDCQELNPLLDWCDPNKDNDDRGSYCAAAFVIENPREGVETKALGCAKCGAPYDPGAWFSRARELAAQSVEIPSDKQKVEDIKANEGIDPHVTPWLYQWRTDGGGFLLVSQEDPGQYVAELRLTEIHNSELTSNALLAASGTHSKPAGAVREVLAKVRAAAAMLEQWDGALEHFEKTADKVPEWAK